MTVTRADCSALHQAKKTFSDLLAAAIQVVPDAPVEPPPGSAAQRVLRFEVIHTGSGCSMAMADTCLVLESHDTSVRFVAPEGSARDNYVSYWERIPRTLTPGPQWQPMSDGAVTMDPQVCVVAQTLPGDIGVGAGAGYLHPTPQRPGDGWTVSVGVRHETDVDKLNNLPLSVTVSARPDWGPKTARTVVIEG